MPSKLEFTCETTQILINSIPSLVIQTEGPDPLSSLENTTLKIRTVFCSSGAVNFYKGEGGSHIFVVHSNLNSVKVVGLLQIAKTYYILRS